MLAGYPGSIPDNAFQTFIASIGAATNFLQGSTSKRIPYEIVHCLRKAISDWDSNPPIITTALSPDLYRGFYFLGVHPNFYRFSETLLGIQFDNKLAQISLPEIYRRRPLYCTPLYHELGHFVDVSRDITGNSLIKNDHNWPLPSVPLDQLNEEQRIEIQRNHRAEYFADLFSAMYTGSSGRDFLISFAGSNQVSFTHPATMDRSSVIDDFLNERDNPIVDLFNETLARLGLPELTLRFARFDISGSFDNVHPVSIENDQELHGIFDSGWTYMIKAWKKPVEAWSDYERPRREEAVNDLVEKSIRNYMMKDQWSANEHTE